MNLTKENVLSHVGGVYKPLKHICCEMAMVMRRTVVANEVLTYLIELVNDGRIETHLRQGITHYRVK